MAERRSRPNAVLPALAFVEATRNILKTAQRYPSEWPRDEPVYDGAVITLNERHEIGRMRFSDAMISQVATLEEAVRTLLKATFKVENLDGIPIDWSRLALFAVTREAASPTSGNYNDDEHFYGVHSQEENTPPQASS